MFRAYLLPIIRRYSLYMYSNWYVLYVWVTGSWSGQFHPSKLPVTLNGRTDGRTDRQTDTILNLGFIKGRRLPDYVSNYQLLKLEFVQEVNHYFTTDRNRWHGRLSFYWYLHGR
jgi:hypothetical protein